MNAPTDEGDHGEYPKINNNTHKTKVNELEDEEQEQQEVEDEDEEEEDLEKLQAEIERMEAEAARITKEAEDLEKGKGIASSNNKKEDPKETMKRDGCVFLSGCVWIQFCFKLVDSFVGCIISRYLLLLVLLFLFTHFIDILFVFYMSC
jgi:hypothetical protein